MPSAWFRAGLGERLYASERPPLSNACGYASQVGVVEHGVDMDIRNLSARLSASDLFYSTGREGWAVSESRRPPASVPRKQQARLGDLFAKLPEGSAG